MSFILRNYQQDLIERTRQEMLKGHRNVLIQLPTGGGKTAIATTMIKIAHDKGRRIWFVCNRQELVNQTARALYRVGVPFSYIAAGFPYDSRAKVFVCSVQTLHRRLKTVDLPDMVYWDETRGIAAKSWSNVFFNLPKAYHIGLDATPCRLSGEPLKDYYSTMIKGPTVRWLIDNGYLCDYKIYAPRVASFEGVKTKMGDYDIKGLDSIMNEKKILGNAVREYKKHALGKRNLVFCNSIMHSRNLCQEFLDSGIKAASIDGTMKDVERERLLKEFELGIIPVLTSVDLVTAGLDIPSIECVTLERATKSVALAKQMIGRGLRTAENKEKLIILDHVNMWQTMGLPDDEFEWSLEGHKRPKRLTEKPVKMCEKCYFVFDSYKRSCPECGHAPEIKVRHIDIEHTDDELVEIDKEKARVAARKEQWMAQSKEDLERLGIQRYGERNGRRWAHKVFQARQAKKLRGY